jgi:uncharacterized protein (UPF0261 family)
LGYDWLVSSVKAEGVTFRVYPNDHTPRHVHGEYAETVAIVELRDDRTVALAARKDAVMPGNAKRSDVKKILKVAASQFEVLVAEWERMHPE